MNKQIIILIIIGSGLAVFCQMQDIYISYLTEHFIDKKLPCLLETGDCDGFGKQIKRKDHIQFFYFYFYINYFCLHINLHLNLHLNI